jgi:IPT/TIG domain-containing protein
MRWLILLGIVVAATTTAAAQPETRDHRKGGGGPHDAPPPDKVETVTPKAGFVWIGGHWEWRGGKWQWLNGHFERERAGKKYTPGHWDHRGDTYEYTGGTWVDAGVVVPGGGGAGIAVGEPNPGTPGPRWDPTGWELLGTQKVNGNVDHDVVKVGRRDGLFDRITMVVENSDLELLDLTVVFVNKDRFSPKLKYTFREGQRTRQIDLPGDARAIDHIELLYKNIAGGGAAKVEIYGHPAGTAGAPVPPGAGGPRPRWRLERPVVSSYWPIKGKIGSRIVIRGRNFPGDMAVVWGGTQVTGAKVTPDEITFVVPPGATTGLVALRGPRGRDLPVGTFEIKADYDPVAEARRVDEERRRAAEAAWAELQKRLAKDHAARLAAYEQRERELAANREQRRAERIAAIRAKWEQAFLNDPETQDELTLHAQRVADLTRAREVAEIGANGKLVVRIDIATSRENDRHEQRMKALHDAFGTK